MVSSKLLVAKLSSPLHGFGFTYSKVDSSLFIYRQNHSKLFVLVYVEDILITGCSTEAIDCLLQHLQSNLPIKDLGQLNYFLSI